MSRDTKISSPSRSRGGIQKRVVSVPIKDVQRLRLKGHDHQISAPPSDSWAWRKYGQKPIKGSPYPRGYYKCSSSKGCPARKQVERSKLDPNMLVVTYSCEHNHPWPPDLRNNYHHHHRKPAATSAAVANITTSLSEESEEEEEEEEEEDEKKAVDLNNNSCESHELSSEDNFFCNSVGEWPLVNLYGGDQFGLFSDFESSCTAILECPILADDIDRDRITVTTDNEMAMIFTAMIEEDDSLIFSDLGELPECATVFRRV